MPLSCCYERVGLCPGRGALRAVARVPGEGRAGGKGAVVDVMYERVAGLDVGKDSVTVCIRGPGRRGRHQETRTFKTTFGSLRVMRDWLVENGVEIAAMESTSTY